MPSNRFEQAEVVVAQQTRAFGILIWFSRGLVGLSMPLAILAGNVYRSTIQLSSNRGLLLATLAFLVTATCAVYFYRRIQAPGISHNDVLRRLSQGALTSSYPALVGVAVSMLNGSGLSIIPFGILAVANVETIRRTGRKILSSQTHDS